jgi:hypothetical protein
LSSELLSLPQSRTSFHTACLKHRISARPNKSLDRSPDVSGCFQLDCWIRSWM